ncbi:LOW QUALITY PROTEIN: KIF-binding protein-like [Dermacentor silvarum]|uniref:LOW QUALITY PROTEIN: KIF-binding protein-like n=1 Tax=Dermacentor silvarum TaxID=543639 RepID=UPI0018972839|nr:LOW QUALITY PROTEIN: KIF-binding protein-like [Dermacentor silvarum]
MAISDAAAWTAKLAEYRSQYERVRKLIDVDSGSDPATEPYKSKYEARRILKELLEDLGRVEYDSPRKDFIRAVAKYELGVIATDTEEVSLGQEYLEECLRIVGEERYADPESRLVVVAALNQLGIVHVRRGDAPKALEYLKKAEAIYAKVSASPEEIARTANLTDLFVPDDAADRAEATQSAGSCNPNFELANAHTLYYLAQVYENLGENAKAAMYCHSTLKKELTLENFDSIDWSINAATLSQFFIARGDFGAGRHLLACSKHILNVYEKKLDAETLTPEEKAEKEDKLRHRFADVARCWAKYGLFLLIASREQLTDSKTTSGRQNGLGADNKPHVLIKSPEVSQIEESITDKLVTDFEGARPVFLKSQKWLEDAKQYYTLKDHATDYIEIVQEMSKLYRELAAFEPAPDRKCKMHKRRIDMHEEVLKEVNPRYYLGVCRQIMFELGEVYSEMMSLKLAVLPSAVNPQSPAVKKVNSIIDKAIRHYLSFLDTVKDPNGKYPEKLPEDLARPVLVAHFYIGRLYSSIIAQEPREQFENFEKTKEHYEFVNDYCKRVPEHEHLMKDELQIMAELLKLIPGKLQQMMSTTLY